MSRSKPGRLLKSDEPILDISSLIDVCFLLLIYFMVTATIQPRESDIGLQLPGPRDVASQTVADPMLIEVQQDGSIMLNKAEQLDLGAVGPKRELPMLQQRLEIFKAGAEAGGTEPLIQVAVDGEASQQALIDVMNCLSGLEIRNVAFTDFSN